MISCKLPTWRSKITHIFYCCPFFKHVAPNIHRKTCSKCVASMPALDLVVPLQFSKNFTIGGSRGGRARRAPPPYGSRFFRFDMQNFWNVAASGVHGPLYEVHAPPYGKSWIRHCLLIQSSRISSSAARILKVCRLSCLHSVQLYANMHSPGTFLCYFWNS